MNDTFNGFSSGPFTMVQIPTPFFTEILPLIDDLAELKVVLFCFRMLPQKEGRYPYLRYRDFAENELLMAALSSDEQTLQDALERALNHQILLDAQVRLGAEVEALYFANTVRGRAAIDQIRAGKWQPGDADEPVEILPERPGIFELYEQNIGQLTPMIADELKDMQQEFPQFWVEEALQIAVTANKRNIRYMRGILERWRKEGKDGGGFIQRRGEADGKQYVSGRYADFLNH
jgi:DNA replication protein